MLDMELGDSGLRYRVRRALRQIGDQHRRLGEIRDALHGALAAGDRPELREHFVRYRHAIGAHFELEDGVFFPALHGLHPEAGERLEALGVEHAGLLARLQRLAPLVDAAVLDGFAAGFQAFGEQMADHEGREEALVSRLAEGEA
jgi:hypothetical protein